VEEHLVYYKLQIGLYQQMLLLLLQIRARTCDFAQKHIKKKQVGHFEPSYLGEILTNAYQILEINTSGDSVSTLQKCLSYLYWRRNGGWSNMPCQTSDAELSRLSTSTRLSRHGCVAEREKCLVYGVETAIGQA
jgi:hypothetical protein